MNNLDRLQPLLASLAQEVASARAGSDQNQFPILDLMGNLRDASPAMAEFHKLCADAWERVVRVVESAQPFSQADMDWLNALVPHLQSLAAPGTGVPVVAAPAVPIAPPTNALPLLPQMVPSAPAAPAKSDHALIEAEEPPLNLNIESDADLLREFINESREHLDNIEQGVLVLENSPNDAETLNTVFRAFHTFKGGAGFLNLMPINRLAHVLESLLDMARRSEIEINAPVIDVILRGGDLLKKFVNEIDGQISGTRPVAAIEIPTAELKGEVTRLMEGECSSEATSAEIASPVAKVAEPAVTQKVSADPMPSSEASVPAPAPAGENQSAPPKSADAAKAVVKVDTAKLDALLDLVGEMVIAESLVSQNLGQSHDGSAQFTRNLAQLGRITHELQRVGMSLRMVPIRGVFQKMARVARDLSAKQNKKVQFLTSGEDTELDRGVVEELNDPLLHMIRNSMDHGIETPEKRAASGKSPAGSLSLRAFHQGGNIVVEIEDDGSGLNRERIFNKAVERGLISADAQLSDEEVFAFIFAPGFSTAEKITDLSGRGVGLDVVRRNIERLRGRVDISSKPGQGTLFKITLPLTLAIIDGLIVKVGDERYILPTLSVRESFRPTADMISRVHNRAEVVNVRGRLIPLLRLYEYFGIRPTSTDPANSIFVVAQAGTSVRCLMVDALLHKQEVVIKNLNDMMVHKNRALAGATILGDGRVGLILDVNTLVNQETQLFAQAA